MKILLDVHTHTVASGHAFSTLQEMVRTAADKGLQILGITEHTGGIPGTCSPIYFRNLPVVPRLMYGVELLLGAEINIVDYEGSLDLEEEYFKFLDIRKYSVIYDAIEEVKAAMEGMLAPEVKEQVTATIEVREVFNITKVGLVAGALVKTGKVKRSDKARLIRDGIVIFTGSINALKRFKDDVKEVGTNFECGISLTNCNDIKVGDIIESYEEIEVKQTL